MSADEKTTIIKEAEESARKSSAGECLAKLFLILADPEMFGKLRKLFKNNQLTAEKQKKLTCIQDVACIMDACNLTMHASTKAKVAEVIDDAGLAFQLSQMWTTVSKKDHPC